VPRYSTTLSLSTLSRWTAAVRILRLPLLSSSRRDLSILICAFVYLHLHALTHIHTRGGFSETSIINNLPQLFTVEAHCSADIFTSLLSLSSYFYRVNYKFKHRIVYHRIGILLNLPRYITINAIYILKIFQLPFSFISIPPSLL
jgi:hypothetical protein